MHVNNHLAAENVTRLEDDGSMASVGEILGSRETSEASAGNHHCQWALGTRCFHKRS